MIYCLLMLLISTSQLACMTETKISHEQATAYPHVVKINDDLYVGKVGDSFYLAMERVRPETIKAWEQYATMQAQTGFTNQYLVDESGSTRFNKIIREYREGIIKPSNELWIAYASDIPVIEKAKLSVIEEGTHAYKSKTNPHIEMFFTVVTSPEALITSHMGISRTWETAADLEANKRKKHADQSVHLHSFAAKVMKIRDPRKVYMLTTPVEAMRNILIKKMPAHSIFIGDDLYQKKLEAAAKDPRTLFSLYGTSFQEREKGETEQQHESRMKKIGEDLYSLDIQGQDKFPLLKTNPPRIIRTQDGEKQTFTILSPAGKSLVGFDQSTPIYQWLFTKGYQDAISDGRNQFILPYVLVDLDKLAKASTLVPKPTE